MFRFILSICILIWLTPLSALGQVVDWSAFTDYAFVQESNIVVPTVLEVPLANFSGLNQTVAIKRLSDGALVESKFIKNVNSIPVPVEVLLPGEMPFTQLSDNNYLTVKDFFLSNDNRTTSVIYLRTATPISSSAFDFVLAPKVAYPQSVRIYAYTSTGRQLLVTESTPHSRVNFLETSATMWEIEFVHTQPLRLAELRLLETAYQSSLYQAVRFLAVPGESYQIHLNPDRSVFLPRGERPDLDSNKEVLRINAPRLVPNPSFVEADEDEDQVIDRLDNCVSISNPDQIDVDQNGRGDACDDWDKDGVKNVMDNCPSEPNQSQLDTDTDGMGDACDKEESRFTERNPWVAWLGLVTAALTIFGMFMMIQRREKVGLTAVEDKE